MLDDLPPSFCVDQQARRWLAAGCLEALVGGLRAVLRLADGRTAEPSAVVMDNRTLRSTPESGERAGYDGAKRKKGTKLHAAVDTLATCWRSTSQRPTSTIGRLLRPWRVPCRPSPMARSRRPSWTRATRASGPRPQPSVTVWNWRLSDCPVPSVALFCFHADGWLSAPPRTLYGHE